MQINTFWREREKKKRKRYKKTERQTDEHRKRQAKK